MILDTNELRQLLAGTRPAFHLLLIWLLAWFVLWLVRRLLRGMRVHILSHMEALTDARRIETLINVFRYSANVVVLALAITLTLGIVGISVTPILATAGVAGIAVGFGAQSLVKDFFTGFFLLIENQVSEGDTIEAAGKSGHVERVTLRHIRVRDIDGSVHFIPNGMITTVTNRSRGFAYAMIDFTVKRSENLEALFRLMHEVGNAMRADPVLGQDILDDLEVDGVEKIQETTIELRCRMRVKAGQQTRIRREFLSRTMALLDKTGEIKVNA
jgi:moderate conductance mechanosensitive channel